MSLDKIIKVKMLELSKKYDISLIEIQKPSEIDDKTIISKIILFNYKLKNESPSENNKLEFRNKRELVSWLVCLK